MSYSWKKLVFISLLLVAAGPFFAATLAHADTATAGGCTAGVCTYVPLEPLPCAPDISAQDCQKAQSGTVNFSQYVSFMFRLLITLGALFAVLMLVIAGIGYMISDSVPSIDAAKQRARAALYGLLLLTACWLILYTINPNLLRFDLFATDVPAVANSGAPGTTAPTSPNLTAPTSGATQVDPTSPTGRTEVDNNGQTIPFIQTPEDIQKLINAPIDARNCAAANDLLSVSAGSMFIWAGALFQPGVSTYGLQQGVRSYAATCAADASLPQDL
jgi:hypothetical protein